MRQLGYQNVKICRNGNVLGGTFRQNKTNGIPLIDYGLGMTGEAFVAVRNIYLFPLAILFVFPAFSSQVFKWVVKDV